MKQQDRHRPLPRGIASSLLMDEVNVPILYPRLELMEPIDPLQLVLPTVLTTIFEELLGPEFRQRLHPFRGWAVFEVRETGFVASG